MSEQKKQRPVMLHFHNGHSLDVWCGRRSHLVNWTTVASWVSCRKCLRMMDERQVFDAVARTAAK